MTRLWSTVTGVALLFFPLVAQAQVITGEKLEAIVEKICGAEMYISAPEVWAWEERCNYRFEHGGARVWVSYINIRDFREEPCPVPKPWCAGPERHLTFIVRWPGHDEPNFEEFINDEGLRGEPTYGVLQSAVHDEQRFGLGRAPNGSYEGEAPRGLQYGPYWRERYRELVDAFLTDTVELLHDS